MNEYQPAPEPASMPQVAPTVPSSPMAPPPTILSPQPKVHTGLWVALSAVVVLLAVALSAYLLMQSEVNTVLVDEQATVVDPEIAEIATELEAERLDDLGAELGAIEKELAQ